MRAHLASAVAFVGLLLVTACGVELRHSEPALGAPVSGTDAGATSLIVVRDAATGQVLEIHQG